MTDHNIPALKQAAVEFLQLVVAGRIDEAYRTYVEMGGRHHNPYFPAGFPELQKAMAEDHVQSPNKQLTVKNVIGEGGLVAVHSHLVRSAGDPGFAVVHLFRFSGGRIAEMWDCGMAVPPDSPNADGAF